MTVRLTLAREPFLAFSAFALASCGDAEPLCRNTVVREAVAPDGQMKATLFERSCGATTGFSSQVSVLRAGETESGRGNALIADTAGSAAPAAAWGGPDVAMEWTGPRDLILTYHARARIIVGESSVRGVNISHKSRD